MPLPTLDIPRIVRETFVVRVEHHATLGSTNDRAKQVAAERPGPLPLLIVADAQTAGRGRGTNRWWTGRGSLACSLLVDLDGLGIDRRGRALVALAAGAAIVETASPLLPSHAVGLHWPNDVYAAGRKLAGVLVEVPANGLHVIGIGINTNTSLADAPPELRQTATSLLELTAARHDPTDILCALLERLAANLRALADTPERIAARANALCLQRGQRLTVRVSEGWVSGQCEGIAPDGALLLRTRGGPEKLYSGEVRRGEG